MHTLVIAQLFPWSVRKKFPTMLQVAPHLSFPTWLSDRYASASSQEMALDEKSFPYARFVHSPRTNGTN